MSLQEMYRYIDQVSDQGIPVLLLSGGEPFLIGRDLDLVVGYAAKKGLVTQCITAAHWATSKQRAVERLRGLADAGLGFIAFSCDDYHQEFVDFQNVKRAVEAAVEVGLSFAINNIVTNKSTITKKVLLDEFRELLETNKNYINAKKAEMIFKNLAQQRDSHTLSDLVHTFSPNEKRSLATIRTYEFRSEPACEGSGRCTFAEDEEVPTYPIGHRVLNECNVLFSILVFPDGAVKACVGHMHSLTEADLEIGNLLKEDLGSILARGGQHPVLKCLEWGGPSVIAQFLMEKEPSIRLNDRYRMSCHLCNDLFTNPVIRKLMYRHIDELYEQLKPAPVQRSAHFLIGGRSQEAKTRGSAGNLQPGGVEQAGEANL
jgi:hypothetical protein